MANQNLQFDQLVIGRTYYLYELNRPNELSGQESVIYTENNEGVLVFLSYSGRLYRIPIQQIQQGIVIIRINSFNGRRESMAMDVVKDDTGDMDVVNEPDEVGGRSKRRRSKRRRTKRRKQSRKKYKSRRYK